jgi:hypothetical protein
VSRMCCAYLELSLFVLIACMCSLYRVRKYLPVCPMHLSWQSLQFIWYTPLMLYMSVVLLFGCRWCCIVFFCSVCYVYVGGFE